MVEGLICTNVIASMRVRSKRGVPRVNSVCRFTFGGVEGGQIVLGGRDTCRSMLSLFSDCGTDVFSCWVDVVCRFSSTSQDWFMTVVSMVF